MRRVELIGDSHLRALQRSLTRFLKTQNGDDENPAIALHWTSGRALLNPFASKLPNGVRLEFDGINNIPKMELELHRGQKIVFSGGLHTSRMVRLGSWETHCPWQVAQINEDLIPLSDNEVFEWITSYNKHVLDFLKLAADQKLEISVMESPHLLNRIKDNWNGDANLLGVVDEIVRKHMRRLIEDMGIPVITTPIESYNGYWTLDEYASHSENDIHHGNPEYGALMFDKVLDWAGLQQAK